MLSFNSSSQSGLFGVALPGSRSYRKEAIRASPSERLENANEYSARSDSSFLSPWFRRRLIRI